jgi:hypothetical protein
VGFARFETVPVASSRCEPSNDFRFMCSGRLSGTSGLIANKACDASRLVPWSQGSDLASSCQRLRLKYATLILEHNRESLKRGGGVIILVEGSCLAHVLHREIESFFANKSMIGNLYATAFSCSLPGVCESISQAVKDQPSLSVEGAMRRWKQDTNV